MGRRSVQRGVGLVECLIYMALLGVLLNILAPLFVRGWRAGAAAQRALHTVQAAEITLAALHADFQQACRVYVPQPTPGQGAAKSTSLILERADGAAAAYVLKGERLVRYERTRRGPLSVEGKGWQKVREFAGRFVLLQAQPMSGARQVYRLDLHLVLDAGRKATPTGQPALARFVTAFHLVCEPGSSGQAPETKSEPRIEVELPGRR